MTSNQSDSLLEEHIQRLQRSIGDIEHIIRKISYQYDESQKIFKEQLKECSNALGLVKQELNEIGDFASACGYEPQPDISLKDPKLKSAWKVLYRFHEGATADTIAECMGKHRTTVSTYLNMLVSENYAQKERIGHEIYYKAVI